MVHPFLPLLELPLHVLEHQPSICLLYVASMGPCLYPHCPVWGMKIGPEGKIAAILYICIALLNFVWRYALEAKGDQMCPITNFLYGCGTECCRCHSPQRWGGPLFSSLWDNALGWKFCFHSCPRGWSRTVTRWKVPGWSMTKLQTQEKRDSFNQLRKAIYQNAQEHWKD